MENETATAGPMDLPVMPINRGEVLNLAEAFERSATWLQSGQLDGPAKTHPLVGIADYKRASEILRAAAWVWAVNSAEA